MKKILPILFTIMLLSFGVANGNIYTVNTTADAGAGSLRQAIQDANSGTGGVVSATWEINFSIPSGSVILLNSALPTIQRNNLVIDATIAPMAGYTGNPTVILRRNGGATDNGFHINWGVNAVTIRGFILQNFSTGIRFEGNNNGGTVANNWIGLTDDGSSEYGTGITEYGVTIRSQATGIVIGSTTIFDNTTRNVISGCNKAGIFIENSGTNHVISNNYVGTNSTGTTAVPNGTNEYQNHHGIHIVNTSSITIDRNIASGNIGAGIRLENNSNSITIKGNYVGVGSDGSALGNRAVGVWITSCQSITVGGSSAIERNIISANGSTAIPNIQNTSIATEWDWYNSCGVYFEEVRNSFIKGNYIGTDVTGNSTGAADIYGNLYAGVKVKGYGNGTGNTVGGTLASEGNVVGGNGMRSFAANNNFPGHGILLQGNVVSTSANPANVYRNYVGISPTDAAIGNKQDGISLLDRVEYANIGGNGLGNISSNNNFGVFLQNNCNNNKILGNYLGTNVAGSAAAPNLTDGIAVQANCSNNYIGRSGIGEGNVISGNTWVGISIRYGGFPADNADNNFIQNNIIGLDATGTFAIPNVAGILIDGGSTGNTIGGNTANHRNIISGNTENGIQLNNGDNTTIQSNYVGLNSAGAAVANGTNGIYVHNGSQNNTIGGSAASVRNVISSNGANGIFVNEATTTGNIIRGNYIGLSTDGSTDMGNAANGIYVLNVTAASSATATTIGGLAAADGNVISGNNNTGILIENSAYTPVQSNRIGTNATGTAAVGNGSHGLYITGTSGNGSIINNLVSGNGANGVFGFGNAISITDCGSHTIQGNYCGTDAAGTTAIPNLNAGLSTTNSNSNTVGGTPAQRNIFSGNDDVGVYLNNSDNSIFTNNYIGVGSTVAALGNVNDGVVLENGSSGNRFGGVTGNEGNIIASNGGNGITISGATSNNNSIHQNKIYCNTLRGIELNDTGNDNPSFDRPAITVASTATMLYGTSEPGATIEIFGIGAAACATCPDDPERIQGRYFLGFVTADVSGDWEYPFTGERDTIVVTASVLNTNTGHNTSEFSACAPLCVGGTTAIAGLDQPLCDQTSVTMNANAPNTGDGETGTWTQYSGPAVSFVDDNDPQTQVNFTDVVKTGTYVFVWSISTGICPPSSDTVSIINSAVPTTADAGSNIDVCATTANITGNTPTVGNGAWSFVGADNGASIGNDLLASTTVNDLAVGTVTLRWTISNGTCTPSTSDITVTRDETPTTADAGSNIDVCATTANITGNTPTVGNGAWSFVGADNGASIGNDLLASTTVNNLAVGTVTLRWTISNGSCTPSTSDITVTRDETPTTADAGSNIDVCATTANITGNTPTVGNGAWSFVGADNGATIGNDLLASTTVNDLAIGTVTLRWTISNGSCTPSTSDITVTRDETPTTADAGSNIDVCATTANITGNTPTIGSGAWSFVGADNGATIGNDLLASTTVNDLAIGTVTLRWTISNGSCTPSTSDITVTRDETPTTADAGSNIDVCATTAAITGNTPAVGTGTWSFVGSANGASINDNTQTSTTVENLAVGSVTLRWTISNGSCTPSTSDITITRGDAPTTANAGSAIDSCVNTSVQLSGNAPASGETGTWTVQSGTATIPDASDPAATITVTSSPAVLRWEITNGICTASHDDVTITISSMPSTSDAGADEPTLCADNTTLNATPAGNGTGQWLIISGTGTITDDLNPASPVTGISTGTLSLEWVISSGSCPASRDTVDIVRQPDLVLADAGADRPTCATSVVLAGNDPGTGYTGEWSPLTLTFSDVNDPNATVSGLAPGANTITWTITGPCGNSSEDVIITQGNSTVAITATASKDTICAGSPSEMSAIVTGTSATPLTYIWTSSDNSLSTSYEAGTTTNLEVTPSAAGWVKYYVSVVDDNGCGNGAVDSVYSIGSQALKIPNLITPNGDSRNDCLEILDTDGYNIVPGSVYQIYNRWGEAVYKNDNYANGDFCGSDLADGMYYFYLKTSCDNREFKGWLHILSNTGASIK